MDTDGKAQVKLDIFALPNQTNVVFALIVLVLLIAILAGSIGPSPMCVWPLALGLLFLPLRSFLARPDRDCDRLNLEPATDDLAELKKAIEEDARDIGLARIPQLLVTAKTELKTPYMFGTFRSWYLVVSNENALQLQEKLADPDQAPVVHANLLHELYHFKTGDYWKMGYAGELLRTTFRFMAWALAFLLGFGMFLVLAAPDMLDFDITQWLGQSDAVTPEIRQLLIQALPTSSQMTEVREKAASINMFLVLNFIVNATWPFMLASAVLWAFFWPKLWRLREWHADAGAVQTQGDLLPFLSALTKIPLPRLKQHPNLVKGIFGTPKVKRGSLLPGRASLLKTIRSLTDRDQHRYHPKAFSRIACVKDPARAFDGWMATAVLVGSLVLLLDVLLSTPLTLFYVGSWPMHFPTLTTLVLVSLYVLPPLVQGKQVGSDLLKIIAIVVALRLGWLLFTIGLMISLLIVAPQTLGEILSVAVAGTAHYAGYSEELAFDDLSAFVGQATISNLGQVFLVLLVLLGALALVTFLLRRLLTWYRVPQAGKRLMKAAYLVIGTASLFLGVTLLPFITTALLRPTDSLDPVGLLIGTLGLMVTAAGAILFFRLDQRYGRRCPACGAVVPGFYHIGKTCQSCSELLHPWLMTEYRT